MQSVICSLQSVVCSLQSAVCSLQMSDTGSKPLRSKVAQFKMALGSGRLVTSIISPRTGRGAPDCSKTKLTFRPHPRESKS